MSESRGGRFYNWYIFRPYSTSVEIEELIESGKKRIDILVAIDSLETTKLFDYLNDKNSFLGHFALRVTSALSGDRHFTSWFIEREGDLFSKMLLSLANKEIQDIIYDLFNGETFFGLDEIINNVFNGRDKELIRLNVELSIPAGILRKLHLINDNDFVAVKYYHVPKLISRRIGYLYRGWIILPLDILKLELKRKFQKKLESKVNMLKRRLRATDERYDLFTSLSKIILDYWRSKKVATSTSFEGLSFKGGKLYELEHLFPPCMRILLLRLKTTGYLNHGERLQLGLFLKRLGMSLEEQLQFWYQIAVDNVGLSWEEFDKKAGYIIRHIYGKVGSMKDYEVPKCETIITKYFCPFEALNIDELTNTIKVLWGISNRELNQIIKLVREQKYQLACSAFLSNRVKRNYSKPMSHPLTYFRITFRSMRGKEKNNRKVNFAKGSRNESKNDKGGAENENQ